MQVQVQVKVKVQVQVITPCEILQLGHPLCETVEVPALPSVL